MTELEFSDITTETKGAMSSGRLKLTEQNIIFKNNRTGKVDQVQSNDVDVANWQKFVDTWAIRLFLKNGSLHRFCGFKESEKDKITKYFKSNFSLDMSEKELSLKGWNWGTAKFIGSVLSFEVGNHPAFEIPLNNVSQCPTGKNEVTIEFHQNDDAPVGLLEMRFHIPSAELAGDLDPVEAFHKQVMRNASVISVSGDAIAIFREIHCLTPRGRYDIKLFQSFFQLHGKTFDYKIPISTVLRLFMLPHKDGRQHFFVVSLDPPIKQGQTRYHFLVFLFGPSDDEMSIELPFSEEELKEKYEGKLEKELQGPTYEVLGKVMKAIVNRKITVPGNFVGNSGVPTISCSYKAAAGFMYPLERGFIYIHKPPLHIRFEEISSVNFARSGGSTRSFDFEVELKNGVVHTFSSIEKEEYGKLYDFISSKKLRVKNRGKMDKPKSYTDDFGDSDQEGEPDAYLARVKREAEEREDQDDGDSEESTDEDYNPNAVESDVAEEYDSNPASSDSDSDDKGSGGAGGDGENKEKKKKKKEKSAKTISEKPRKRRQKKERDENKPKRAATAYMLWFNENREKIKADNPGIAFTDIAKKGGELWKKLDDKSEWEGKAAKAKAEYEEAMKEYKASGGGSDKSKSKSSGGGGGGGGGSSTASAKKKSSSTVSKDKSSPTKVGTGDKFISKEYISDDDSSSDGSGSDKKKPPPPKKMKIETTETKKSSPKSDEDESEDDDYKGGDSDSESDDKSKKKAKGSDDEKKPVKKEKSDDDNDEDEDEESGESTPATSDESGDDSD